MAGPAAPAILLLLLAATSAFVSATPDEGAALLHFKSTLSNLGARLPSWVPNAAPCTANRTTWAGIICFNGHVWGVQLENMGLTGRLDLGPLVNLRDLRTLSFMHNAFEGPMPDLAPLGPLKAVYLSNNKFSGEIPDDVFTGMRSLKKVFLSYNRFSGPVPTSLAALPKLLEVRLDHNKFAGEIPEFGQPGLKRVDVSFNSLEGAIPGRLSKMDSAQFQGNKGLCGPPLTTACNQTPPHNHNTSGWIIASVVLAFIAGLLILAVILSSIRHRVKTEPETHPSPKKSDLSAEKLEKLEQGTAGDPKPATFPATLPATFPATFPAGAGGKKCGRESEHGRLAFVKRGRERFELHDLLRASAEVLGSGNFGASYKAAPPVGGIVVVKRFKEMNGVGREEFNEHMRRLGRLSHPNVLPLVAYFYKKEAKLLVFDFVANGSLAHMLHGNRGSSLPPLGWPARLKIVKGVARGLAYLYDELVVLPLPHGHLKSSNVLLDADFNPLLADYALAPVINPAAASQLMVAYKSPELAQFGRPSRKSDVWTLGILILEILTGKFPANLHKGNAGGTDLAAWVGSVMQEDWGSEVFDAEINGGGECHVDMKTMLTIGLDCCEDDVAKRPEMREAVQRIEEVRERSG